MIEFRPLTEADLELVAEWLRREHVAPWWNEPVEQELDDFRAAIDGREPSDPYLIVLDGSPIGLVQAYRVSDYPEWDAVVHVGPGVAGVDLLIGAEELIGRGLGPGILREFTSRIVFADVDVRSVVATVEEPNRRSWRAFEKAGFRHVRDVEERGLPHRLLWLDRPR